METRSRKTSQRPSASLQPAFSQPSALSTPNPRAANGVYNRPYMSRFTYLHLRTHFSRDGGPASPAQWCQAAAELGYESLGVADRGPLAGMPAFSKAARATGIQPVYGMEADILLPATKDEGKGGAKAQSAAFFALHKQGLDSLARLASIAYARWPQEEQPLDWPTVAEHSAGLALVLLAGGGGMDGPIASAGGNIRESFGGAAYVGLPYPGKGGNQATPEKIAATAGQMGLPVIAMPTARYIRAEDKLAYEALQVARRRAGWSKNAHTEAAPGSPGIGYLLSPDEAASLYAAYSEALENAARLVKMCAGVGYLDEFAAETLRPGTKAERPRLQSLAEEQLLRKLEADSLPDAARQWLDDELAAHEKQNALPSWSALASICDMARSRNGQPAVPMGAPLGTADGSLLAYALGVSPVNPLDYPRPSWLSEAEGQRVWPAPGVELPANRRDDMLSDMAREYGPGRAALAACRIDIDPLTALSAASEALGNDVDIRPLALQAMSQGWNALIADQAGYRNEGPTPSDLALSLKGAPITFKPDPDMLLVAPVGEKLPSWLPLLPRGEGPPVAWVPVTEEAASEMRLPAVVLRPSSALTALASTVTYATQYPVPGLSVEELDLTGFPQPSAEAAAPLAKGELAGIPYLAAGAVKGWKGEITPTTLAAIIAGSSASRKAPAAPKLDQWTEHTADTEGSLLYRDQFEALVSATSGLSPAEAYRLRALLLKDGDGGPVMQMKERFATGCAENGLDREATETLWQALAASAPDLQSRCSIATRARATMWAAFFKARHPAAFLAAHLSASAGRGAKAVAAMWGEELRLRVGIKPPDAGYSMPAPTLERGGSEWTILWGLALLPGWTGEAASRFVAARPRGGFVKMADFALAAVEAGLTLEQLETLVRAGGCDNLGGRTRSHDGLLDALPEWLEWARAERAGVGSGGGAGQADLFAFSDAQSPTRPGEEATFDSGMPTPRQRYLRRKWEVEQLGIAFTPAAEIEALTHTLESSHLRSRLLSSARVGEEHVGKSITLVGLLTCIRLVKPPSTNGAAPGEPMCVAWIEDSEGAIEVIAFPPGYKRHAELWTENNPVIVTAKVRRHEDGELYLLCEHMAPFESAIEEAEITARVKPSKKAQAALEQTASQAGAPGATGSNGKGTGNGTRPPEAPSLGAPGHAPAAIPATGPLPPSTAPAATPVPSVSTAITAPTMTNQATTATDGPPAHKIIITLPITEDDRADIDRMIALKEILREHPGTDAVTLRIPYSPLPGHLTTAQLPRGVSYSTVLEAEVVRLLGTEAIAVIRL